MTMLAKIPSAWDFKNADTKQYTHCYHNYPAMMIPQIAAELLIRYGENADTLFDPYCGTGTSLVEANLKNINAIGTDLNPLARLIAKTKTANIELQILDLYLKEFNDFLFSLNFANGKRNNIVCPEFNNIDFWFSPPVKIKLSLIKKFIISIKDENVRNFFLTAFSETVRESSLTRNSEFKLYRMTKAQMEKHAPDVDGMIMAKLARNRRGLTNYRNKTEKFSANTKIFNFNTVESTGPIADQSVDIVITSPPYGDSKTTVAYGQFSRLANQWLDIKDANRVDQQLMGGKVNGIGKIGITAADNAIERIAQVNEKRAGEVFSFYQDYAQSITRVAKTIKKGGHACYVVGNRRVKDTTLPTDKITTALFQQNGFCHQNTFTRNIPNKRMPSKNSPSNQSGKTATTINKEFIVVMKKLTL